MEEFVNLLAKIKPETNEKELASKFKEVAKELMSKYAIRKGNDYYQMVEIEFYWYSPNHPDLSVYPRKSEAGNWFLHPSGVDITLESCIGKVTNDGVDEDVSTLRERWEDAKEKEKQKEDYFGFSYGGILIRTLRKFKKGDPEGKDSFIVGPWNCSDILFDYLPCDGNEADLKKMIPVIEAIKPNEMIPIIEGELPNDYIGQALRSGIDDTHTAKFYNKPYCFYVNKQYVRGWEKGTFPNKPWNSRKVDFNESSK